VERAYNHIGGAAEGLYSELLDLALAAGSPDRVPLATVVTKTVRGHRYLYLQRNLGGHRQQLFLGPDNERTSHRVRHLREGWEQLSAEAMPRERLVTMLRAAGAQGPDSQTARVLTALSRHGAFRAGGVLVGTQALVVMGPALGVSWTQAWRTEDVDVASERLSVAVDEPASVPIALEHTEMAFLPVPGLDPRHPTTSYKLRGRALRLDMLTPLRGPERSAPIRLPALGVSATPLRHLGYLIEDPMPAAPVALAGDLVIVPQPARFALHKLVVASHRPVAWATRATKDRQQAAALLSLLANERYGDLGLAWQALGEHKRSLQERVLDEVDRLDSEVKDRVLGTLPKVS